MKLKALLMTLLMLIGFSMAKAEVVEIGSGVDSNNDSYWLPTDMNHNYSVVQSIYTADEIGMTGTINSISYYKITARSITRNLDVYLVQTDKSSFLGNTSDWIPVTAVDKVFSGEVTYAEGSGWNKITFDKPYEYNKNKNLAVVVDDNTNFSLGGAGIWFRATRFNNPTVWVSYKANSDEVDINPVSISGTAGSANNSRCQIRLDITPIGKNTVKLGGGAHEASYLPTSCDGYNRMTQQIYTADEIGMAGTIKSFSFKTGNQAFAGDGGWARKVKVYMAHTSKSSFSSGTDFINLNEAVLVYDGNWLPSYTNKLTTFTLTNPFDYDGTSNLAFVWVDQSGSSKSSTALTYDAPSQALCVRSGSSAAIDVTKVYPGTTYYGGTVNNEKSQLWLDMIPLTIIGTNDGESSYLPIANYSHSCSEQIYTSAEIGRSGYITSISFRNSSSMEPSTARHMDVYIAKTNKSSFSGNKDWVTFSESDKVFSGTVTVARKNLVKVTFDKPFRYNGTGNIVIGVADNSATVTGSLYFNVTNTSTAQAIYAYSSNGEYGLTMSSIGNVTGITATIKNQIMFGFQDEWQVGEGDATNSYLPTYGYYNYSLTQQIYTKADLGKENADITSLAFFNKSSNTATRKLDIYLTSPTEFTSYPREAGYSAEKAVPTPADMVFSGDVTFTKNEWTDIPLNKGFHYSYTGGGAHSLVVTVIDRTGSYQSACPLFLTYPAEAQAIYRYNDISPYTLDDVKYLCQDEDRIINSKNQIQFNNVGLNPKPVGLHAEDLTFRSATIKWYGEGGINGWNFEYKQAAESEWIRFGLPKSYTSFPLSDLMPQTTYDIRVQTVNGSETSEWMEARFSTDLVPTNLAVTDITCDGAKLTWDGPGSMWRVDIKKESDLEWTVLEDKLTTKSYQLTELEQDESYDIRVYVTDETSYVGNSVQTSFMTPELYPKPTSVEVLAVTTYSAAINWVDNCEATSWQIMAYDYDEGEEAAIYYTTSTKPFIMTGLKQGTTYIFSIRSIIDAENGVYGNWSIPEVLWTLEANPAPYVTDLATTPSSATITWVGQSDSYKVRYRKIIPDIPFYVESFETSITDLKSKGWQFIKKSEAPVEDGWDISDYCGSHSGDNSIVAYSWTSDGTTYHADNWLISPLIDLQGMLEYWENVSPSYRDKYEVLLSTTGTNIETDFTTTLRPMSPGTGGGTVIEIDLSEFEGQQGYVAFHHVDYDQMYLAIDDFGTYDISGRAEWQTIETDEKTVTIEGLDAAADYEYEVVGVMKGNEDSSNGIFTFTTMDNNPAPYDVVAAANATSADISWKGNGDKYIVKYRENAVTYRFFDDFGTASVYGPVSSAYDWTIITESGHVSGNEGWFGNLSGNNFYAASVSYWNNLAIDAHNWLITPKVSLGGTLKYKVLVDKGYKDKYAVLLSTTGKNAEDFTTVLRALAPAETSENAWTEVSIDLTPYEGQQGYIAICHQDKDKNYLGIDDFEITLTSPAPMPGPWQTVTVTDDFCWLGGLSPNTVYEYKIVSIKAGEPDAETDILGFVTSSTDPIDVYFDNNGGNSYDISSLDGTYANVTINNFVLHTGAWTGICLPFDVDLENSVLAGSDLRTLESSDMIGPYYTLDCLSPLTYMSAGIPYIIKWNGASDLVDPTFPRVTIVQGTSSIVIPNVRFLPATYDAYTVDVHRPDYYLTTGDGYCGVMSQLVGTEHKAFDPEFYIPSWVLPTDTTPVALNTGDNPLIDGISAIKSEKDEVIFNVAGQRLGKVQKGVNIVNGKKLLVK